MKDRIQKWLEDNIFMCSPSFIRREEYVKVYCHTYTSYPFFFCLLTPNLTLLKLTCHIQHICVVFGTTCAKNKLQDTHVDLAGASIDTRGPDKAAGRLST